MIETIVSSSNTTIFKTVKSTSGEIFEVISLKSCETPNGYDFTGSIFRSGKEHSFIMKIADGTHIAVDYNATIKATFYNGDLEDFHGMLYKLGK